MYRLQREPFDEMREWLTDVEGFWGEQLEAFRDHVAKRKRKP
jgi:hypothetical protein